MVCINPANMYAALGTAGSALPTNPSANGPYSLCVDQKIPRSANEIVQDNNYDIIKFFDSFHGFNLTTSRMTLNSLGHISIVLPCPSTF